MGLSTLSRKLRRRPASHDKPKDEQPPSSRTTSTTSVFTRRSIKHLTPEALLTLLQSLSTPLTSDQLSILTSHISNNSTLLEALIAQLIAAPTATDRAPRTRLAHSWIVATLFRFGPSPLRDALSSRPHLLRNIASVFAAPPVNLDPALATHATDVLRIMLHDYPRDTATALQHTSLARNLVAHIALQPAADFLPRLVSHRVFSTLAHAPLVPMHKRAIVMLGKANVQHLLADAFVRAAAEFPHSSPVRRMELVPVLDNSAGTMAELSARAMCLQRKYEDLDERTDAVYAACLQVATSYEFNDAAKHMTLVEKPAPLQKVLNAALGEGTEKEVLLPAVGMVSSILFALREARTSVLPSVRRTVNALDWSEFEKVMAGIGAQFAALLDEEGVVLGRRRLGVIDLVRECCELLSEDYIRELLTANEFCLLRRLLFLCDRYRKNDVLQIRVAQILHAVFTRYQGLAMDILLRTKVLDCLDKMKGRAVVDKAFMALVLFADRSTVECLGPVLKEKLFSLVEYYHENKIDDDDSLSTERQDLANISSEWVRDMNLEEQLAPNEDYGQELYIHQLLDEVSISNNRTPPTDSYVSQTASVNGKGWGKSS